MAKLAALLRAIKPYALNPRISEEEFLNAFLRPYVLAGGIKNKFGEEFYLNKTRTSSLMNYKEDVPQNLRAELGRCGIREKTAKGMIEFVEDYINPTLRFQLSECLLKIIHTDTMISKEDRRVPAKKQSNIEELLMEVLFGALSENNRHFQTKNIIWRNGDNSVEAITGDLFRYGFGNRKSNEKNIVVIPVNTAFDMQVTRVIEGIADPGVSEKTIHGQWIKRMEQSGEDLAEINKRIKKSLIRLGRIPTKKKNIVNGKSVRYDIGSVAVIEMKKAIYFLLAISEFDKENRAHSTPEDIVKAVKSLLEVYDRIGQGYDMYMPVMGTGRSRTGMKFSEAYKLLTTALINKAELIQGHIFIVVRPENEVDIKEAGCDVSN